MRLLPEPIIFEWNTGNIDKNLIGHNVTDRETEEVFGDRDLLLSEDTKHSQREFRLHALGLTQQRRLLFLSFTIRGDKLRIISARNANRKERKIYAEKS